MAEHMIISQIGIWNSLVFCPFTSAMPRRNTLINFLAILRAMHECRARAGANLAHPEKLGGLLPVHPAAGKLCNLGGKPAQAKPQNRGEHKPQSTRSHSCGLMPLKLPCSAIAAPESPAISAWLSLVGMPKNRCRRRPDYNCYQCRAKRHRRLVCVAREIHHVVDTHRNRAVEHRHDKHAQEVEHRRHQNRQFGA